MEFPVDVLVSGRHEDLESSAQSYMNKLLYSNPDHTQYLNLPSARKVTNTRSQHSLHNTQYIAAKKVIHISEDHYLFCMLFKETRLQRTPINW